MSTLTQMRVAVAYELGMTNSSGHEDETRMNAWLNEAVLRVLVDTHCRVARSTMTTTTSEEDYELPSGVLAVHSLKNSDAYPFAQVTKTEMDALRRGASTATSPGIYRYAVDGSNMLMLYPTPSSAETLTIYYVPRPTAMSADANDPSTITYGGVPAEYHYALELWAYHRGASADDDTPSQNGRAYLERYEQELKRIRTGKTRMGGRKLAPARIGRRAFVASDPSADVR